MLDKIFSVFTTALVITGVGIAFRPGSSAPQVIDSAFSGLAKSQTAAFGPQ